MEIGNLQPKKIAACWRINNEGEYIPICVREEHILMFVPPGYDFAFGPPYIAVCESDENHSVVGLIAWSDGMVVDFVEE
ncbi:MAG: hypothetical protein GY800_02225 [Planctomycetes bacterium]|nr:hypothetical protein [Planctomycetota bacterium]